jgi:hypothetical protein
MKFVLVIDYHSFVAKLEDLVLLEVDVVEIIGHRFS